MSLDTKLAALATAMGTDIKDVRETISDTVAGSVGPVLAEAADAAKVHEKLVRPHIDDFGAVGDGTTDDTAALVAAMASSDGEQIRFNRRKRYSYSLVVNGNDHVNFAAHRAVQQSYVSGTNPDGSPATFSRPLIQINRRFGGTALGGSPTSVTAPTIQLWGAVGVQGSQFVSTIALPSGGYSSFASGDVYHISSNDLYTWNAASGGSDVFNSVKAGFLTIQGIGLDVNALTSTGASLNLAIGQSIQGATSGAKGLVQSFIAITGTTARITLEAVTGDFTSGENLVLATGGRLLAADGTTALTIPTTLGTAGAMCLVKVGETFEDTYTTSVKLRKVDTSIITSIEKVTVETNGNPNAYMTSSQRKDAILIDGCYGFDVGLKIRNAYCRGLMIQSCYFGTYDVKLIGVLPNHTDLDQIAVGYGVSLSGCTEKTEGTVYGRGARHVFTTNTFYTASWDADGTYLPSGILSDIYRKWGTVKYNRVSGYGAECTNAPFDSHPGAMGTIFQNCVAYAHTALGRTGSSYQILFTTRGIGTQFIDCHAIGGSFNNDGVGAISGFKHTIRFKNCTTTRSPQHGYSQLYDSARVDNADSTKGYWAKVVIEDCNFNLDRNNIAGQVSSPYTQVGILVNTGDYEIRNTIISGFNGAPISIKATSSGSRYLIQNVTADYLSGLSTTPFQFDGTVDLFVDNYGIVQSTASKPTSVFEGVGPSSGSYSTATNLQLFGEVREFSKLNLPPLLVNTAVTTDATRTSTAIITTRTGRRLTVRTSVANQTVALRTDATTILWNTALTTDAVFTLPIRSGALSYTAITSDEFEVSRSVLSTGAFSLLVKSGTTTIAKLGPGGSVKVKYEQSTDLWYVIDQGVVQSLADPIPGVTNPVQTITADALLTMTRIAPFQSVIWTGAITADRVLTLPSTAQQLGDQVRVTRTAASTGSFNINVTSGSVLKALVASTAGVFQWNGTAWILVQYGSL